MKFAPQMFIEYDTASRHPASATRIRCVHRSAGGSCSRYPCDEDRAEEWTDADRPGGPFGAAGGHEHLVSRRLEERAEGQDGLRASLRASDDNGSEHFNDDFF